jgi:hypothetical protein
VKFRAGWAVFALVAAVIGPYYLWAVRSAGGKFDWGYDLGGYYDYLGRGFASGRLSVPIEPNPKLLSLPNPWDPAVDDSLKMQDMALYNGRYYLYHGAAPAALLFAPWRLATGHDLPENFALFLLCFGGFLFSCGALLRILDLAGATPGPWLLGAMLLALGVCQSVPDLLSRVWVYEIAIGGGYFFISGAVYFLARGLDSERAPLWFALSGLLFGLAVACRPHLGLAGVMAAVALWFRRPRSRADVCALAIPFALVGAVVAIYNYARFGDPLEFGIRYLLAGADQNRIKLDPRYVLPGLYFNLFCLPEFGPVFPWIRAVFRYPFDSANYSFPPGYFIEPAVGAFCITPFLLGVWPPGDRKIRVLLAAMLATAAGILLFLSATGFTTQRYEVDFLPLATLVALAAWGIRIARTIGLARVTLTAILTVAVVYSAVANLALGIAGPYDEMLKNRPARWVRIAQWFSPLEQNRPRLNPKLTVEARARFTRQPAGSRELLVSVGRGPYLHSLYAEHTDGPIRLVMKSELSTASYEMAAGDMPEGGESSLRIAYSSTARKMTVEVNERPAITLDVPTLVMAPSEVAAGEAGGIRVTRVTCRAE